MRAGPRSDRKGIGAYASTPVLSWTWGASLLAPAATGADCGNPQPGCTPTKFSSNPRTSPSASIYRRDSINRLGFVAWRRGGTDSLVQASPPRFDASTPPASPSGAQPKALASCHQALLSASVGP